MKRNNLLLKVFSFFLLCVLTLTLSACEGLDDIGVNMGTMFGGELFKKASKKYSEIDPEDQANCSHEFDTWATAEAPTCTTDGYMVRVCLKCFYVETKVLPATGHTYDNKWTSNAYGHYHQALCEHRSEKIDYQEHSFGEEYVSKEATCNQSGTLSKECSVCGYKLNSSIPKLEHEFVNGVCIHCGTIESQDTPLLFSEYGSGLAVTGYTGNLGDLNIPSYINGLAVVRIEGWVFNNNWSLTSVTIPDTVTEIGDYAFQGCGNLKTVTLPNKMSFIGSYAFAECNNVRTIKLPDEVDYIYDYAFQSLCNVSEDTNFPSKVGYIGQYAFNCSNMFKSKLVLPEGLTYLGYGAFQCNYMTELALPSTLTTIEQYVFQDCRNLASVSIPEGVQTIRYGAFNNSYSLVEVEIPSTMQNIEWEAFSNCTSLLVVKNYSYLNIEAGSTDFGSIALYALKVTTDKNYKVDVKETETYRYMMDDESVAFVKYLGNEINYTMPSDIEGKTYTVLARAFYDNYTIEELTVPDNVVGVGAYAFANMWHLKKVTIGTGITKLSSYMFQNDNNLTSIIFNGTITDFGSYSLQGTGITELNIPEGVTTIGMNTFENMYNLKKVTFPSTLTTIEQYAFAYCSNIETIEFNEGLKKIDSYAFIGCSSLNKIVISSTVETINWDAFWECNSLFAVVNLSKLNITKGSSDYGRAGYYALIVTTDPTITATKGTDGDYEYVSIGDETMITSYFGSYKEKLVLPEKINGSSYGIGPNVFQWQSFKYVEFPSTLKSIGSYAFQYCDTLVSVALPEGLVSIGQGAFQYCQQLVYAYIPSTLKNISLQCFCGCRNLKTVGMQEGVETIGNNAFQSCYALEAIYIPQTMTTIEWDAFFECTNLFAVVNGSKLNIVAGSENFGKVAYYAYVVTNDIATNVNVYLTDDLFKVVDTGSELYLVKYQGNKVYLTLPEKIDSKGYKIGKYAFRDTAVREVTLPNTLEEISDYAFAEAYNLEKVFISSSVKKICKYAFSNCTNLVEVSGWDNVTTIDNCAFMNCSNLTNIVTPSTLKSIGEWAFGGEGNHSNLRTITLNEGLTKISNCAFSNSDLISINIPSTVSSIEYNTFDYCFCLLEIINPYGVSLNINSENIGKYTVLDDASKKGYFKWDDNYEFYVTENKVVLTKYVSDNYVNSLTLPDSFEGRSYEIGAYAFYNKNINSITTSKGVTSINGRAFYCTQINSIKISSSVKTVCSQAFMYCQSLTSIIFDEGLERIEQQAFFNSNCLTNVKLPNSLKYLGTQAFACCNNLSQLVIPESIEYLGSGFADNTPYFNNMKFDDGAVYIGSVLYQLNGSVSSDFVIKDGTSSISSNVFCWISGISSITIPKSVKYIGNQAFYCCNDLRTVYYNGSFEDWMNIEFESMSANPKYGNWNVTIKFYNEDTKEYETLSGDYHVKDGTTELKAYMFYGIQLTNLYLPKSIKYIKQSAFENFSVNAIYFDGNFDDLASITYQNESCSLARFNLYLKLNGVDYSYFDCNTEVRFSDKLTSISAYAFLGCNSINQIYIPKNVKSIGQQAFTYCVNLTSITIDSENECYYSIDNSIIEKGTHKLIFCNGISIPEGVKIIASYSVILNNRVDKFVIPEGVETIENYAIQNASYINAIVFPSTLRYIGTEALRNMKITTLTLNEGLESIGNYAFAYCYSLKTVILPSTLIEIKDYAFESCTNIKFVVNKSNLNITKGTWENGQVAYYASIVTDNEEDVQEKTLNGMSYIETKDTVYVNSYSGEDTTIDFGVFDGTKDIIIESSAFINNPNIQLVKITKNVKKIKNYAFSDCGNCDFEFEEGSKLEYIGSYAFSNTKIKEIKIPSTVTTIESGAFSNCRSLEKVMFEEESSLSQINSQMFNYCTSLKSINIPDSVVYIYNQAFYYCTSLETVTFGENSKLNFYGNRVYYKCSSLTSITIPKNVCTLENRALDTGSTSVGLVFENTNGWYTDSIQISSSDLTVENAYQTYSQYKNQYWYRDNK